MIMSGGHFGLAYAEVLNFALNLKDELDFADRPNEDGETPYAFQPDTRAKLREIEALALKTSALMREVEWLFSGDTGDDTFMAHTAQIEIDHNG